MNVLRLAKIELRRITAGRLPRLAVLALVLVPLLYGALYLYANSDPYQRLDRVPAALVVLDNGDSAAKVAEHLRSSGAFQWHQVDQRDADAGVRDGRYTFALTLPPDFSAALSSAADFAPRQGLITLTTNDANNYLAGTMADRVVGEVRASVGAEVGTEAANKFLVGFGSIYDRTSQAAAGATQVADGAGRLATAQQALLDGVERLSGGAASLSSGLNTMRDNTKDLPAQTSRLAGGARQVADGAERASRTAAEFAGTAQGFVDSLDTLDARAAAALRQAGLTDEQTGQVLGELRRLRAPVESANTTLHEAAGQLGALAAGARQVTTGADRLAAAAPALAGGAARAAAGAGELNAGAVRLRDGERAAVAGANDLAGGTVQLRDGLTSGLDQIPHPDEATRDATARTIGDPLAISSVADARAGSYGAGLAPFFLGLATWIGAFVLFLVLRPLSSRALAAGGSGLRTALAGWLPAALLGLAQVTVLFTVVTTVVGIHPAHPLAAFGFLALTSLTFVAVVHALNAFFGPAGKFLALLMLILQLISAGGTFPWQTLPEPLYPLHAGLPMGYVVHGMRHLLYGGPPTGVGLDALVLLAYLAGGLLLTTLAARRRRMWTPARLRPELVL
ncbi:YhgE/Pip family protein [Actinophytocola sp.]|uniref:YhgE/Pip family protein n=1 Tax=Actinophytocola sp. TaxID=1872138 RepID=UPI002D7ED28E|nr:YhgE/Pip family protein [Actinophytocola sp.]HET9139749.1 YhgE/Pip family protein [Actinophytocola sp.]